MNIPHFGLKRQYPKLREELLDATDRVLQSGQFLNGQYTTELEDWLAKKTSAMHVVTVHSGTQALEIIARYWYKYFSETYEIPSVRIPNITYPATLNAFLTAGWDVELCDTDEYGIIQRDANDETSEASCVVGLYGRTPQLGKNYSLTSCKITDGAQHWLAEQESDLHLLSLHDGMAISFDPTKNLPATGNGGAILTDNQDLYNFAKNYKSNGTSKMHMDVGTNSKMSEQDCAHVLVRTKYIDQWQARRKAIRHYYIDRLKSLPIRCLSDSDVPHCDQKFVISLDNRNKLHEHMQDAKIETRIHYPYLLSDLSVANGLKKPDMLSKCVHLLPTVLSLPIHPELSDAEVETVANTIRKFYV